MELMMISFALEIKSFILQRENRSLTDLLVNGDLRCCDFGSGDHSMQKEYVVEATHDEILKLHYQGPNMLYRVSIKPCSVYGFSLILSEPVPPH